VRLVLRYLALLLLSVSPLLAAEPARFNAPAPDVGEPVAGFPNWSERVILEWINRARCDPQVEMAACGANCGEAACYSPIAPLPWNQALNHSARFHADEMLHQGYFVHDSQCALVSNINALYPTSCDGSASCACVAGTTGCQPCTTWSNRVQLFGVTPTGEIIASPSDPDQSFYLWLFEPSASQTCAFSLPNGHRWLILTQPGSAGPGVSGESVVDFGPGPPPTKLPSGGHYPLQAANVDFWANWYDTAGPSLATVVVDGACYPMVLSRGSPTNGAYHASISGLGSGCHRYYFLFADSSGVQIAYPTTGSFGVGPPATCPDWDPTAPPACPAATATTLSYYTIAPCRLVDTRRPTGTWGGPVLAGDGATRAFPVAGQCGVPSDAVAVSANVTVLGATRAGDLRIYPSGILPPSASAINFRAALARANNVLIAVNGAPAGSLTVRCDVASGTAQMLFDVNGYFR
jgi:hypothetical protein